MFGRKKKAQQSIPWYRKRGYKGNLTEEEKMELDSFDGSHHNLAGNILLLNTAIYPKRCNRISAS